MKLLLPARHPFRKLKSYYQVWPYREEIDGWMLDESDPRPPFYPEPESNFQFNPDDINQRYIGNWQQNDAPVISLTWTQERCVLTLNDYEAWRLSTALANDYGFQFPLKFCFENLNAIGLWQVGTKGTLARLNRSLPNTSKTACEYIGEKILQWSEDRFVAYFELHGRFNGTDLTVEGPKWNRTRTWFQPTLLLGIDCQKLVFEEHQAETMAKHFGNRGIQLYKKMDENRYQFSQGAHQQFFDLIESGIIPEIKAP